MAELTREGVTIPGLKGTWDLTYDLDVLTPLEALGELHSAFRDGVAVDIRDVMDQLTRLFREV
ncbi:hypothetical protein KIV66_gp78 [Mycobacterium phage MyraDee]|uniref:Uncharacterized protein n=1 Tax=Mycobacterium phage MyraDee TaxID=2024303 RepID=A0A222Z0V3_9CAUD|nr:hypothetical protein KIV66_gp78 [Mycobacterium phage MyraDee]ASR77185.1 hypothetical protein SEA_MYRADEE_78 [Mycobacterium phage MyraDee]